MLATYSTLTVAIKFKNISNKFCQLLSGKSKSIKLHFYLFQYVCKMKKYNMYVCMYIEIRQGNEMKCKEN